jgi:hypothetical protein
MILHFFSEYQGELSLQMLDGCYLLDHISY